MRIRDILKEFREELENLYENKLKSIILLWLMGKRRCYRRFRHRCAYVLEGKVIPGKEIDRMIDIITEINLKHGVLISVSILSRRKTILQLTARCS